MRTTTVACSPSARDGFLYIGVGDGGSANDPPNNPQNTDLLLGKILRMGRGLSRHSSGYALFVATGQPLRQFAGPRRDLCGRPAQPMAVQFRPRDRPAMGR